MGANSCASRARRRHSGRSRFSATVTTKSPARSGSIHLSARETWISTTWARSSAPSDGRRRAKKWMNIGPSLYPAHGARPAASRARSGSSPRPNPATDPQGIAHRLPRTHKETATRGRLLQSEAAMSCRLSHASKALTPILVHGLVTVVVCMTRWVRALLSAGVRTGLRRALTFTPLLVVRARGGISVHALVRVPRIPPAAPFARCRALKGLEHPGPADAGDAPLIRW
jgi:hypothetical protein